MLRTSSPSGRPTYVFQHAQPSAHATCSLSLCLSPGATQRPTLDDLREAMETLEDAERIARRVFGGAHLNAVEIGDSLRTARAVLRARDTPSPGPA